MSESREIVLARKFVFILGSARAGGNTESLTRYAADQLPPDVSQQWLRLSEVPLSGFADTRHNGDGGRPEPVGNERLLLEATLSATDLVVASPLYWYSVSAPTKLYFDYWSGWMWMPEIDFRERMRNKTLWAVSTLAGEDPAEAGPLVEMLRRSADYLGMRWGGALLGRGSRPEDILGDLPTLERAELFFRAS